MGKQRLEMDKKLDTGEEPTKRRIDLSVAQVAGSAVAAVVAAVLASQLGVYGTVIGAGVVSVVATSGGTIFQHVFKRTGEQLREVTVHAKPKAGRPFLDNETRVLRTVEVPADLGAGQAPGDGEFTEATVHGTKVRGWKRSALAAAAVFAVAMGGITTYELVSQKDLSGGEGTSIGNFVRGGGERKTPPAEQPATSPGPGASGHGTPGTGGSTGPGAGEQSPGAGSGNGDKQTPAPGASSTPDPGSSEDGAVDGANGGGSPSSTPPAKETPAGNGGADGSDEGSAEGKDDGPGGAERQQAPPPQPGATSAP
ncbi:hypothetical protein [Streptomyces sp. NPDC058657]|uniref:hypothetical protein n=1 Tax=unclassified Streptomyces TaxID=2593676 RepID=UPI003662535F